MVNTQPAQNPYELKKFWSSMQWFGQCNGKGTVKIVDSIFS